jgi:hypothetical protein
MKTRTVVFMVALLFATVTSSIAFVPNLLNFQGTLADSNGNPVNDTLGMEFSIYSDSSGGGPYWSESHTSVEVIDGLLRVQLGSHVEFPPYLFDRSELWVGITISPDLTELSPRQRLAAMPYAFEAEEADHAVLADTASYALTDDDWSVSGSNIYRNTGYVGIGTTSPQDLLQVGVGDESAIRIGYNPQMVLHRDVANNKFKIQLTGGGYAGKVLQLGRDDGGHDISLIGNVGVGTTDPSENLQVEGGFKVGASGVVYDEMMELTGQTSSMGYSSNISYPEGYDMENTRVLSCELKYNGTEWISINEHWDYELKSTGIKLNHPDAVAYHLTPYRLLIAKVQ